PPAHRPPRDEDVVAVASALPRALPPARRAGPRGPAGDVHGLRRRLMDLMWDDAGVIRTAENLTRAQAQLGGLEAELLETGLADDSRVFNLTWHDWLNLRSLVEVSQVIAAAALARENSCGAHYREDCPGEGDPAEASFTIIRRDGGGLDVSRAPVNFSIVQPGESLLGEDHATLAAV
ncbi:MAG: succinate dehydrogenase/fumarate reductase flavoprotein subunit, partial [Rhodospirillaceae bacterium]|nr:succinate dehydrogenase/fumarate reductase flavoprotein subunit [Rhodospirillaceae bacterium]